jgi:hypothetical protein
MYVLLEAQWCEILAYTVTRSINRQLGTVVAVLEIVKLVGCNCVIAMGISNYVIESVDDIHEEAQYVIWAALYVVSDVADVISPFLPYARCRRYTPVLTSSGLVSLAGSMFYLQLFVCFCCPSITVQLL